MATKLLKYADVFAGLKDGAVEAREFESLGYTSRVGRSSIDLRCPFCQVITEVFTWSFAGGGKRCQCGALFGSGGVAYAKVEEG